MCISRSERVTYGSTTRGAPHAGDSCKMESRFHTRPSRICRASTRMPRPTGFRTTATSLRLSGRAPTYRAYMTHIAPRITKADTHQHVAMRCKDEAWSHGYTCMVHRGICRTCVATERLRQLDIKARTSETRKGLETPTCILQFTPVLGKHVQRCEHSGNSRSQISTSAQCQGAVRTERWRLNA